MELLKSRINLKWIQCILRYMVLISLPITSIRAFVIPGLMLAITGSVADAQQMGLQYTETPFTPQMVSSGRYFIAGGSRWRFGQKVSFSKSPDTGGYSVPFGSRVPGNFRFTSATNNSGVWNYDNGTIDPNNPQRNAQTFRTFNVGGNTTIVQTNPGDSAWRGSTSLGTNVYQWSDPITTPPTPYWSYYNVGSFTVENLNQFTPLLAATFGNVAQVSYDLAFNQSPLITVTDAGFNSQVFDNSVWCPYIEIGFWSGWSVLSFSYSFQAFRFNNTFQKNIAGTLYPYANSLTDSFDFSSIGFNSDGTRAPSNPTLVSEPFSSIAQVNSGSVLYSYSLNPLSGNRVFKNNGIEVSPLAVTENLSVSLDTSCYENRLALLFMEGAPSRYGLGFSLGPVATRVHSTLNYQNVVIDPTNPDNVLLNTGSLVKDQWHFGAFGSLDMRMSLSNSIFACCSVDCVFMSQIGQGTDDIQCAISPGGYSISVGGGIQL